MVKKRVPSTPAELENKFCLKCWVVRFVKGIGSSLFRGAAQVMLESFRVFLGVIIGFTAGIVVIRVFLHEFMDIAAVLTKFVIMLLKLFWAFFL